MVATGAMKQGMLGRRDIGLLAAPDPEGRLLDGACEGGHQRPMAKAHRVGRRHCSAEQRRVRRVLPPDRKATPATAAGTVRRRHRTVAVATVSTGSCCVQVRPGSTMFGFRIIASRTTNWVRSSSNTAASTSPVTASHRVMAWLPAISTPGSTTGTSPASWQERGVAGQGLRVGANAGPAGLLARKADHRAPLAKRAPMPAYSARRARSPSKPSVTVSPG
jgi:hypothetical protein